MQWLVLQRVRKSWILAKLMACCPAIGAKHMAALTLHNICFRYR